jgi:dihydrolipoamide dehydrogenase
MIGAQVSELIAEVCLAIEFHTDSEDVARNLPPPTPTRSEAMRQVAMGIDG